MTAFELIGLLALGAIAWYWLDSVRAREIGVDAARAACAREGVQLLDETVVGRLARPARDDQGRLTLRRVYEFEYSASGDDRHHGSVMLLGREVAMLELSAHRSRLYRVH